MKLQLTGVTADLIRELETNDIDPQNWFTHCYRVNDALDRAGLVIGLDWLSTDSSGYVQATMWSKKIQHTIIIEREVDLEYPSLADMAESLAALHDHARELEGKLPFILAWA